MKILFAPGRQFLLFFALAALPGAAAASQPEWQSTLTSPRTGSFPALAPSVLEFQVSWKGMLNAGRSRMEVAPKDANKPGALVVRSSSRSVGAATALFPYDSHFWSELDPASFRPRYFKGVETNKKGTTTTTVRHTPSQLEFTEVKRDKKGKVTTNNRNFVFSPVHDLFSAMFHVRSQKLDKGDRVTLVVHPFGTPYLLNVKVLDRGKHNGRDAIRLSVGMRRIDRNTHQLGPYKKMTGNATLWLSDDADRVPLEFRAKVFIGGVRATLSRFEKL